MYDIGEKICDMHSGLPTKDFEGRPIKVTNVVKIRLDGCDQLARVMLHNLGSDKHKHLDNPYWKIGNGMCLDNKIVMVVGEDGVDPIRYQAIWTYDNRYFGMLEFEVLEEEDTL